MALSATVELLALMVATVAAAQTPTFTSAMMTQTGSAPWQPPRPAAIGDFNGDGKPDALIVDSSPTVRYLRGNGDGTFGRLDIGLPSIDTSNTVGLHPALPAYLPVGVENIGAVKAADVNGDGRLDAVMLLYTHINWGPYSLSAVLINSGNDGGGNPQFTTTYYSLNFYDVRSLTVGDLNGDARPDYIVGTAYSGLYVHLNDGGGAFTVSQVTNIQPSAGGPAVGPGTIADVNGDGRPDFIVTSTQAGNTNVFFGNGNGTLQAPSLIPNFAYSVAVADMDNDGRPDLIQGFGDGSVTIALNLGAGVFGGASSYAAGSGAVTGLFASDVNGDGKQDVAASLGGAGKIAILPGNGDGTLATAILFGGIPNATDVNLADFTGDGKVDIASVSANGYGGQNFAILTNTTVFAPPLPTQTLTILGGSGNPGDFAANVEYYNPANGQWQPAYLANFAPFGHPVTHPWGNVPGTNRWINYKTLGNSDPGAGPTENQTKWYLYRVRFTVPADAINPRMTFSLKADNFAQVAINGATAGGTAAFINNAWVNNVVVGTADQVNVDATFSQNVRVGENTITLNIGDFGGLNGFNFRIDLSMQSSQPIDIVPVDPDTTAPVITVPADITTEATSSFGAQATFTATAIDNIDDVVSVSASPASGSTFPLGTTTVTLSATDAAGNTATAYFTVTVIDTIAPAVSAPGNILAEATSSAGAVVSYAAPTATDAVGVTLITSNPPSGGSFALGTTLVNVTARDAAGNVGSASFAVTVRDTTAPVIASVTPSQASLWPPNHQMVGIVVNAVSTDAVGVASTKIIAVTSSEPDNGLGDGDTAGDIVITSPMSVNLRAERAGKGNGRTYTITVEVKDAAGNTSTRTCTVSVPKSQGK